MAYSTIDVNTPAGTDKKKFGDDKIREFKTQVVANLSAISSYPSSTLVALKDAIWTTDTRPTGSDLTAGVRGFNTTTGFPEHYSGTAWVVHEGKTDDYIQDLIDAIVPIGMISLWSGTIANIPTNWHLCDGTDGTVDLRKRFVVGAGVDTTSTYVAGEDGVGTGDYKPGDTGGEDKHTITADELASHGHGIPGDTPSAPGGYNSIAANQGQSEQKTWTSNSTGRDEPHENRPPYYALAYIQRIS